MRLDSFSVTIPTGVEQSNGYVELNHGEQYSILITSFLNRRCAAEVQVDGKHVGTFRLAAYGQLSLERPSNDTGKFTFYEVGSSEAAKVGVDKINRNERGLISVTFKPEKEHTQEFVEDDYTPPWNPNPRRPWRPVEPRYLKASSFDSSGGQHTNSVTMNCFSNETVTKCLAEPVARGTSAGITGLSGRSDQTFRKVGNLDYDLSAIRTINLRLVAANREPRQLVDTQVRSTPIPAPVA